MTVHMPCFFRGSILQIFTAEILLTKCRHHNGGAIILIRSLRISLWVCAIGIVLCRQSLFSTYCGDPKIGPSIPGPRLLPANGS